MRRKRPKPRPQKVKRLRNGSAFLSLKQLREQFIVLRRGNHLTPHVQQRLTNIFRKLLHHPGIGEPTVSLSGKLDYSISLDDGSSILFEFIFSEGQVEQDFVRLQEAKADYKAVIYADDFLDGTVHRRVQQKNLLPKYPLLLLSKVLLAKFSGELSKALRSAIDHARETHRQRFDGRPRPRVVAYEVPWAESGDQSEDPIDTAINIEGPPFDREAVNTRLIEDAEREILRAQNLLSENEWVIRKDAYDILEGYAAHTKPDRALEVLRGRWKSLGEAKDTRDRSRIIKVLGVLEKWRSLACILRHLYTGSPLSEPGEKSQVDNYINNSIGTSPYRSLRLLYTFIKKLVSENKDKDVINGLLEAINSRRASDEKQWDPPEKKWLRSIEQLFSNDDEARFPQLVPLRRYLNPPKPGQGWV